MLNILRILLLISVLGLLSGCSVFGIATRSDLQKQNQELARAIADQERVLDDRMSGVSDQQRSLDDRVSRVSFELETIEKELSTAVTDLDSRSEMTAKEVADMRVYFELMQGQVQLALADLESVAEAASRAETGSRQAVQLHHDSVLAERERLQGRLRDLDARISSWYQPVVPTEQLRREIQPEVEIHSAAAEPDLSETRSPGGLQIPESARQGANR